MKQLLVLEGWKGFRSHHHSFVNKNTSNVLFAKRMPAPSVPRYLSPILLRLRRKKTTGKIRARAKCWTTTASTADSTHESAVPEH